MSSAHRCAPRLGGCRVHPADRATCRQDVPRRRSGWLRILTPTLGSLATGYLLWRFFPCACGSGIPQTIADLFIQDRRITFHTVVGKIVWSTHDAKTGFAIPLESSSMQCAKGLSHPGCTARKRGTPGPDGVRLRPGGPGKTTRCEGDSSRRGEKPPRKACYLMLATVMVSPFMSPMMVTCLPAIGITFA